MLITGKSPKYERMNIVSLAVRLLVVNKSYSIFSQKLNQLIINESMLLLYRVLTCAEFTQISQICACAGEFEVFRASWNCQSTVKDLSSSCSNKEMKYFNISIISDSTRNYLIWSTRIFMLGSNCSGGLVGVLTWYAALYFYDCRVESIQHRKRPSHIQINIILFRKWHK